MAAPFLARPHPTGPAYRQDQIDRQRQIGPGDHQEREKGSGGGGQVDEKPGTGNAEEAEGARGERAESFQRTEVRAKYLVMAKGAGACAVCAHYCRACQQAVC